MKIRAVQIRSYKSFAKTGWVELGNHFTVLVGQNSAGKSAFLEAFGLGTLRNIPHRDPSRDPRDTMPSTQFHYRLQPTGDELKREGLRHGSITLPSSSALQEKVVDKFFQDGHVFHIRWEGNVGSPDSPTHGLFSLEGTSRTAVRLKANEDRTDFVVRDIYHQSQPDPIPDMLWNILHTTTFSFDAERYHIGRTGMSGEDRLKPNASNLPYMLFRMQKAVQKFDQFQTLVSEILPSIKRVVIAPVGTEVEIYVQSHGSLREDLLIPLDECGTGTAQVIAIIYILLAFDTAQIAIDEPNSFLHPGAMRRLLQVMQRFTQHQFILSTHAAEVISILRPEVLLLVQWNEQTGSSQVTASAASDIDLLRAALADLGASVSDIYGYDLVVFVEGPTEAEVFPLLVPANNRGAVNFVAMREASALTSNRPEAMFDIYTRGVQGSNLQPPATRFSFDREGRSARQIEDLERTSRRTAKFLPRLMLETYFLDSQALLALLHHLDGSLDQVTEQTIVHWIDTEFANHKVRNVPADSWETCDSAKLLASLVPAMTGGKFQYDKITHGAWLARWLLAHKPEHLQGLIDYVAELVSLTRQEQPAT